MVGTTIHRQDASDERERHQLAHSGRFSQRQCRDHKPRDHAGDRCGEYRIGPALRGRRAQPAARRALQCPVRDERQGVSSVDRDGGERAVALGANAALRGGLLLRGGAHPDLGGRCDRVLQRRRQAVAAARLRIQVRGRSARASDRGRGARSPQPLAALRRVGDAGDRVRHASISWTSCAPWAASPARAG